MKQLTKMMALCAVVLSSISMSFAEEEKNSGKPSEEEKILSYMMGTDIANNLKKQPINIDVEQVIAGLKDIFDGKPSKLTEEDETKGKEFYQNIMRERHTKQMQERAKEAEKANGNKAAGKKFLEENAKKSGVKVTDSGMQYLVMKEGSGESPNPTDIVSVHYHGTLIDGTVFDSSVERGQPAEFPVNGVIKGWQEALPTMKVGEKRKLFIPSELAYGDRAAGAKIPAGSTLIFEVELLKVVGPSKSGHGHSHGSGDNHGHSH